LGGKKFCRLVTPGAASLRLWEGCADEKPGVESDCGLLGSREWGQKKKNRKSGNNLEGTVGRRLVVMVRVKRLRASCKDGRGKSVEAWEYRGDFELEAPGKEASDAERREAKLTEATAMTTD